MNKATQHVVKCPLFTASRLGFVIKSFRSKRSRTCEYPISVKSKHIFGSDLLTRGEKTGKNGGMDIAKIKVTF